jgi:allantoin racemase
VVPVRTRPGRIDRIRAHLAAHAGGAVVHVIDLPAGPLDLEHFVDDHAAIGAMLDVLPGYVSTHGVGAVSIGCFYDPGMWELREALDVPVVGVGEASLVVAGFVASRIAMLIGDWKWQPKMAENFRALGLGHRVCAWRVVGYTVQAMQDDPEGCYHAVYREALAARDHDRAEAIVLGCTALETTAARLQDDLRMPVIDPVLAGFSVARLLAGTGLRTSKTGGYRPKAPSHGAG